MVVINSILISTGSKLVNRGNETEEFLRKNNIFKYNR